jgi:hypothetical protein
VMVRHVVHGVEGMAASLVDVWLPCLVCGVGGRLCWAAGSCMQCRIALGSRRSRSRSRQHGELSLDNDWDQDVSHLCMSVCAFTAAGRFLGERGNACFMLPRLVVLYAGRWPHAWVAEQAGSSSVDRCSLSPMCTRGNASACDATRQLKRQHSSTHAAAHALRRLHREAASHADGGVVPRRRQQVGGQPGGAQVSSCPAPAVACTAPNRGLAEPTTHAAPCKQARSCWHANNAHTTPRGMWTVVARTATSSTTVDKGSRATTTRTHLCTQRTCVARRPSHLPCLEGVHVQRHLAAGPH